MIDAQNALHVPVLLFDGGYYGTLAAVRCLGRAGVPVTVAERRVLAPARWSRYVTRRVQCPDPADTEQFMDWLIAFGRRSPGHMLYPTSDDLAWLFALRRNDLAPYFALFQPPVETIYTLLNKQRLAAVCADVDLETPQTFFPGDDRALLEVAAQVEYPVLIKPQTQIFFASHIKGAQVYTPAELIARYRQFVSANGFGPALQTFDPHVARPMVQAYHPEAADHIYSLSGFVDHTGTVAAVRAARKVLQRPRKLGIGLCFEDAAVDEPLVTKLSQLCQMIGYFGVFEAEFIRSGERALLIDFNPRFYSQMAFEIARGMPLPLLVYHAAHGDDHALHRAIEASQAWRTAARQIYCHRFTLGLLLRAQRLSGRLTRDEARTWRRWHADHRRYATDAVADRADPLPSAIDIALHLSWYARHPRAFVRQMVLDH